MYKTLIYLICLIYSPTLLAETSKNTALSESPTTIKINGAADYPEIAPLLNAFGLRYPHINVDYTEFSTRTLYQDFIDNKLNNADLIMSSAMDLQIKLINDGYAQPHSSPQTQALPDWARWRNEIFGFTYEPAVIAFNHTFISRNSSIIAPSIRSRAHMLEYIRENSTRITGKIGTFDISKVGIGYLVWAHDSRQTASYGRILESFGVHQTRLFTSSAKMLAALSNGEIAIAYNVLGSYANSWALENSEIIVVQPEDYTTVIMRSAFIPKTAPNPEAAKLFLDFLISRTGQQTLADHSSLYPILKDIIGQRTKLSLRVSDHGPIRAIPLGLPLMVQNDKMKRQVLLEEWERSLIDLE